MDYQPNLLIDFNCNLIMILETTITINTIIFFLDWKDRQTTTIRGNILMYDIKGHYKYLSESELFDYYIEHYN
jgi:hypothetical protein